MKKFLVGLLVLAILAIPVVKTGGKLITMGDPWDCFTTTINTGK
jgi:hypothetical protein